MAYSINEIVTLNEKGEPSFNFWLTADKQKVIIGSHEPTGNVDDMYLEIPISEWNQVIKFIKSQENG